MKNPRKNVLLGSTVYQAHLPRKTLSSAVKAFLVNITF